MTLKSLGIYLLQKRYHAVWMVFLFSFLPFTLSFLEPTASTTISIAFIVSILTTFAIIIVALVTLHQGAKVGFFLLSWLLLPGIVASFYGEPSLLLLNGIAKGCLVWAMAAILGKTASWLTTLEAAVVGGTLLIMGFHLLVPDTALWWMHQLQPYISNILTSLQLNLTPAQLILFLNIITHMATGFAACAIISLDLLLLLLARGWQALLFNPGGLNKEWKTIHLHYYHSLILIVVIIGSFLGMSWLADIFPLVCLPFVMAGLSLIHANLPNKKSSRIAILVLTYLSFLFFMHYVCMILIFLALIDSWFDFRALKLVRPRN